MRLVGNLIWTRDNTWRADTWWVNPDEIDYMDDMFAIFDVVVERGDEYKPGKIIYSDQERGVNRPFCGNRKGQGAYIGDVSIWATLDPARVDEAREWLEHHGRVCVPVVPDIMEYTENEYYRSVVDIANDKFIKLYEEEVEFSTSSRT